MKRTIIISVAILGLVCSIFCLQALHVKAQEEAKWCPLCSMNLKMFWKTNHRLTFADGTKAQTCSIHCAAIFFQKRAAEIDKWEAVDYDTKKFINAKKAHFLIGSDLPGTMTAVSKLAFKSKRTAKKYQKEHGGTIGTFDDALDKALADMGEDKKMIMKKVAKMSQMGMKLAGKHGCYKCHGEGGTGGTASAWNTPEFAKNMDSRVKIKQAILGPEHKPSYEGKIPEKELHAITLYIWTQRPKQ